MAYKNILPQTNLDAVDIRDTIGCPSNNLADYCVKAKTGGIGGYAFKIAENGHLPSDGYLIEGAAPYFNIYSNASPAEWIIDQYNNAACRLKRNIYGEITVGANLFNASCYCFDLGAYRSYTHKSKAPHSFSFGASATPLESGQYQITLGFFRPGDYDWSRLAPNTSKSDLYYGIESSNVRIPHDDSTMTPFAEAEMHFGIGATWIDNRPPTKIKSKLGLYRKQTTNKYLTLAYLPMESSESGNSGGNIEIDTNITIMPTPKPMAIIGMEIVRLIGHPYQTSLNGYNVGEVESWRDLNFLHYRIRWKPDLPIEDNHSISAYVTYKNVVCNATVGMSVGRHVTEDEAGGGLNVGDPTWIFNGAVDVSNIQYLTPPPESLILNVQDVTYDANY